MAIQDLLIPGENSINPRKHLEEDLREQRNSIFHLIERALKVFKIYTIVNKYKQVNNLGENIKNILEKSI